MPVYVYFLASVKMLVSLSAGSLRESQRKIVQGHRLQTVRSDLRLKCGRFVRLRQNLKKLKGNNWQIFQTDEERKPRSPQESASLPRV